ncbi:MAG TPA: hypothetical protein VK188_15945 [Holophaga sp.]|nr:hypothetical protein [Holophaga sp.]
MRIARLAGALLLCAVAQGQTVRQGSVKPIWISSLPSQAGRVYAVGLARLDDSEADAIRQAGQNARGEVLSRLRADVKSETNINARATSTRDSEGRSSGSSEQRVDQSTRIQASATELPGLSVEEVWVDGRGATAYALACLDVPVAEREIRTRFRAQKEDLFREDDTPAEPRERMRMLGRLRSAQAELVKLDDMAALVAAGGGDATLRRQVREGRLAVDRQMENLRASLTLSMEGARGATQIAAVVRNAALKAGLGWKEAGGEFQLVMDLRTDRKTAKVDKTESHWNGWWHGGWVAHTVTRDTGIIVARGQLTLTLQDRAGTQYESVDIEAKGLGVTEFQAENDLKKDFKAKVEKTFSRWLEGLVK